RKLNGPQHQRIFDLATLRATVPAALVAIIACLARLEDAVAAAVCRRGVNARRRASAAPGQRIRAARISIIAVRRTGARLSRRDRDVTGFVRPPNPIAAAPSAAHRKTLALRVVTIGRAIAVVVDVTRASLGRTFRRGLGIRLARAAEE